MNINDEMARWTHLSDGYKAAVRQLYDAATNARTDARAAEVSRRLLHVIHAKDGGIELTELRHLDAENRGAALHLIECCASPSVIPDAGLTVDPAGEPLLSDAEVKELYSVSVPSPSPA